MTIEGKKGDEETKIWKEGERAQLREIAGTPLFEQFSFEDAAQKNLPFQDGTFARPQTRAKGEANKRAILLSREGYCQFAILKTK